MKPKQQENNKLMKVTETKNTTIFYSLTYVCSLLLILGLFLKFENETRQSIYESLYDLIGLIGYISLHFWIRKRITLFGLIFFVISWNFALLINHLFGIDRQTVLDNNLILIRSIFIAVAAICGILGLINKFDFKYLTEKTRLNDKIFIVLLVGFSIGFQLIFRQI